MTEFMYRQSADIQRWTAGGVDAYGNETGSWVSWWTGVCRADPMTGEEDRSDRETQWLRLKVFLPAGAVGVRDDDRISIDGSAAWNIEQVAEWPDPLSSGVHHIELRVRQEV